MSVGTGGPNKNKQRVSEFTRRAGPFSTMDNYTNLEVFCSKRFSLQDILKALWLIQDLQQFFYNTGLDTMARVFPQKVSPEPLQITQI